ncbi:MAG: type II secretion system F family protein [Candidatus Bathyarchaeota archaeon]|jgi:flagellar protein FlaJ
MLLKTPGIGKIFSWISSLFSGGRSEEIDRELPFAVMMFTTLAASGVTLYESWKKMRNVHLLPEIQQDAEDIVRQVEVLGYDPLTVMHKKADGTTSKLYQDFLAGFVSSVRSGGSVVSFLRTKLRSIMEVQSAAATRSIEKLGTLVEAYAVMLIVTLCTYILYVVMSSTSIFELSQTGAASTPSSPDPFAYVLIFLLMPSISVLFMVVAHRARKSNFISLISVYLKALIPVIGASAFLLLVMFVPQAQLIMEAVGLPAIVTICLILVSVPSALAYHRVAVVNFAAEESMPSFLRDVTEARKIGLSPEKSIIHASKRRGYGRFSGLLELVRSQIEWGVALKKIFANVRRKIQSWPVLVHFFILVETIEIGGGSSNALEILAEYSEKNRDIEVNKRSMLKPYIVLAFIWSILIAFTTTIVAVTIYVLTQITLPGVPQTSFDSMQQQIILFSIGIIFQCWMSGFFVGKINEGSFAAGFKYSAMLAATAYVSLILSQHFLSGLFTLGLA